MPNEPKSKDALTSDPFYTPTQRATPIKIKTSGNTTQKKVLRCNYLAYLVITRQA